MALGSSHSLCDRGPRSLPSLTSRACRATSASAKSSPGTLWQASWGAPEAPGVFPVIRGVPRGRGGDGGSPAPSLLLPRDLMKPSLQMKHDFKARRVVEGGVGCAPAAVSGTAADASEVPPASGYRDRATVCSARAPRGGSAAWAERPLTSPGAQTCEGHSLALQGPGQWGNDQDGPAQEGCEDLGVQVLGTAVAEAETAPAGDPRVGGWGGPLPGALPAAPLALGCVPCCPRAAELPGVTALLHECLELGFLADPSRGVPDI